MEWYSTPGEPSYGDNGVCTAGYAVFHVAQTDARYYEYEDEQLGRDFARKILNPSYSSSRAGPYGSQYSRGGYDAYTETYHNRYSGYALIY